MDNVSNSSQSHNGSGALTQLEPICLLHDERMLLHQPVGWVPPKVFPECLDEIDEDCQIENPNQLQVMCKHLVNLGKRSLRTTSFSTLAL